MTRSRISLDVDLNGVPQKIEKQIEKGIKNSSTEIAEQGIPVAKNKLLEEGSIWKGELFSSFEWDSKTVNDRTVIVIQNVAEHAGPMENGAEFGDSGPPIGSILPWVKTELADWQVGELWIGLAATHLDIPPGEFKENKELYGKAYWLQQHIRRDGLEARGFMKAMSRYLERNADEIVGGEIDQALKSL